MRKTRALHRAYRLTIASALVIIMAACGGQSDTSQPSSNDTPPLPAASPNRFADIEYPSARSHQWSGPEEIYAEVCAYCHAPKPHGGVGPVLLGRQLPAVYTIYTVRNGRNGMPGFPHTDFTDAELQALADMIHTSQAPASDSKVNMP